MTYDQITKEIAGAVGTNHPDDIVRIGTWVNQAIRKISQEHSWYFLRQRFSITLASGGSTIDLPGEPINPIARLTIETSTMRDPIRMVDRTTAESVSDVNDGTQQPRYGVLEIIDDDTAKRWRIQLYPGTADQAYTAKVDGWFYLPPFRDPNQSNHFTENWPEMVIEKALGPIRRGRKEFQMATLAERRYAELFEDALELDNKRQLEQMVFLQPGFDSNTPSSTSDVWDEWGRGQPW